MKYTDDLLEKYPKLQDIINILDASIEECLELEQEYEQRKSKRPAVAPEPKKDGRQSRAYVPPKPDVAHISRYLSNGIWEDGITKKVEGSNAFKEQLREQLNKYDPDAIIIKIISRRRPNSDAKDYIIEFNKDEVDKAKEQEESENQPIDLAGLREQIKTELKEEQSTPMFKIMEMKLNHKGELDDLKRQHEKALDKKEKIIAGLEEDLEEANDYIGELEDEIDDKEATLGSIHAEYKAIEDKKEASPFVSAMGAIGLRIVELGISKYPEVLDGLELPANTKKHLVEKFVSNAESKSQLNETANNKETPGFKESPSEEWKDGKSTDHVQAVEELIAFFKSQPEAEFSKVYTIMFAMCDKDGAFLPEKANDILEYLKVFSKKETVDPPSPTEEEEEEITET